MPTYEYRCDACGHEFELFQSMTDAVKRKCPVCKKPKLKRLVGTGAGIIFKGSGFYETDYRSDSYTKAAEAEKKATTGGDAGDKKDGAKKADTGDATSKKSEASSEPATAKPAKSPVKKSRKR